MPNYSNIPKITLYISAFVAVMLLSLSVFSQSEYKPQTISSMDEPWRWKSFPELRGRGVRCITEDEFGNIWFGIDKGVTRYDGYNWTNFVEKPFNDSPITVIHASKTGKMYAGGDLGLFVYEENVWRKIFPSAEGQNIAVNLIKELADSSLIVGINNGMLDIKNQQFTVYCSRARLKNFQDAHAGINHVYLPNDVLFNGNMGAVDDVHEESPNEMKIFLSVSNTGKILSYNINNVSNHHLGRYNVTTQLANTQLADRQSFLLASNGDKWLVNAYYKSGIFRETRNGWQYFKLSDSFGGDEIHTGIIQSTDGTIWIGGLGKLYVYKNYQWQIFAAPNFPMPTSRIVVFESTDGSMWLLGIMGEVYRIDLSDNRWVTYKNLNFGFKDNLQQEWYLSADNLVVVNSIRGWIKYGSESGMIDAPVRLFYTSKGMIWVAGSHKGIAATAYFKNNKWVKELHPQLSWGIDYRSVFESTDGSLWFGASVDRQVEKGQMAGVIRLVNPGAETHRWEHHASSMGIGQQNVYGIGQSADGALWLGGSRLHRYDGNRWSSYAELEKLGEYVDIVYSSPGSKLWVGSRFYGLFCFDGQKWDNFTIDEGLSSNTIISVYEESDSSVWAITNQNICWFDGKNWFPDIFSSHFKITREGGNIVTADNAVYINHSLREWKRRAFPFSIAPNEAFSDFWVVKYQRDKHPPNTQFDFFPEKVSYRGSTLLSWSGKDMWEETPSEKLVYSYRINQGPWSDFSSQTNITLTEMKDGHYTFEVKARDLDYNIDTTPATVTFRVAPPVWKQPWFIALIVAFIVVVVFYETRLIKRNNELSELNVSLNAVNEKLEKRQKLIEQQKDEILQQSAELETKNEILEQQNTKILKQRDKLEQMVNHVEELSKVRLRFFTNISHEFRTPLTLILCSIEELMAKALKNGDSKTTTTYEVIQKNTRRVFRLINQILEVRRIESGTMKFHPENGDLILFVRQLVSLFSNLAQQQQIELSFLPQNDKLYAQFDRDKIEKILFNLLSNAFKNTPPQGAISVFVKLIEHKEQQYEHIDLPYIELLVSDTGKGIPAETRHQIFERFYQIDDSDKDLKYSSSGIGLSFVNDLVTIHRGKIHVESDPGKGSCFVVQIPYIQSTTNDVLGHNLPEPDNYLSENLHADIEAIETTLLEYRALQSKTISTADQKTEIEKARKEDKPILLVVEDEDDLRHFIVNTLSDKYVLFDAPNGKLGLEKALEMQPDLIISDIMMPEMDGLEMTSKLKENLITCHIPVILLTAKVAHDQKVEGYETGADAYIEKPFSNRMLRTRIANLLKTREQLKEKLKRDLILDPKKVTISSADDQMLSEVFKVLEQNIADSGFDVESMSQVFLLSRSHFSRKVKQITNLTPKQLLDTFRLKRACALLEQNKLSVSEIAYMVGFDHPNSFSRTFKKYYNVSPSEWMAGKA
ncbi:MAG TPA: ATP-binding protein [Prolixibacteraceae bacterium]|nr:ATP-binding protein [Prolixibacteraceae bacterium]